LRRISFIVSAIALGAVAMASGTARAQDTVPPFLSGTPTVVPPAVDVSAAIEKLVRQRIEQKVPAAYLTGQAFFAGLEFHVTGDVLVPRSPLAELIANEFHPWLLQAPRRILDLCTGSGCIGIAAAMACPESRVDLSDVSDAAIRVAQKNIDKYTLGERVQVIESDLFDQLAGRCYDLILCNPPYVNAVDFAAIPAEYHAEPALGLASGVDGLDFTRRLLAQVGKYLTDDGVLFVEVGNSWEALEAAYPTVSFTWLEFEWGGHGVFMLTAEQITHHQQDFLQDAQVSV
jgi:ribosomal protein L3 glutamine methyltransferase